MARTRRTRKTAETTETAATVETAAVVVDSTVQQEAEVKAVSGSSADSTVCIACSLPFSLTFNDVPNGSGGKKSVTFPGVNDNLRGKSTGILLEAGHSVCVRIATSDWEAIVAKHGRERVFTSQPPKLWRFDSVEDYRAARGETSAMSTGVEPVDPTTAGVQGS